MCNFLVKTFVWLHIWYQVFMLEPVEPLLHLQANFLLCCFHVRLTWLVPPSPNPFENKKHICICIMKQEEMPYVWVRPLHKKERQQTKATWQK